MISSPRSSARRTGTGMDRPLRPLFPGGMRNEVQVIATTLSVDHDNLSDVLAVVAASTALMISDIPWGGPVGCVRVGRVDGEFVINPTLAQLEESDLDLIVSGTEDRINMPIVSELMSADKIDEFVENVDLVQIGARNMQNFDLLKAVGHIQKPVMLKRGMSASIEDWIMSAEYIMANGNPNVILCERGIRTFERYTRNTMDLAVVPIIKERTHLPIVIDPSHSTGDWKYVEAESLAAIAAGCDGLIIEVHDHPDEAWSDGAQSLKPERFADLITKARKVAQAVDRDIE